MEMKERSRINGELQVKNKIKKYSNTKNLFKKVKCDVMYGWKWKKRRKLRKSTRLM
jgi:hypothetical protein